MATDKKYHRAVELVINEGRFNHQTIKDELGIPYYEAQEIKHRMIREAIIDSKLMFIQEEK